MARQAPLRLLITGKMGSGKSWAAAYLEEKYGASRWSRTELMKRLAHAAAHGVGSTDEYLERLFPDEAERADVREELLAYQAPEEQGKPRLLYQQVTELVQAHDPLCFERELAARIHDGARGDFILIDDVRSLAAFTFFAGQGYHSLRLEASEEVRRARMLARDGYLPGQVAFDHSSETELDAVPHDFVVANDSQDPQALYRELDRVVAVLRGPA